MSLSCGSCSWMIFKDIRLILCSFVLERYSSLHLPEQQWPKTSLERLVEWPTEEGLYLCIHRCHISYHMPVPEETWRNNGQTSTCWNPGSLSISNTYFRIHAGILTLLTPPSTLNFSSSLVFLPPVSYITLQFQSCALLATSSPSPPFFVSSACTLSSSSLVLPLSLLEARWGLLAMFSLLLCPSAPVSSRCLWLCSPSYLQ